MWAQALALIIALDAVGKMAPVPSGISASAGESITRAEALELMKEPQGSLSLGWTSGGALHRSSRLSLSGPGYAFFKHIRGRETFFGTEEMEGFVTRVGARLLAVHPDSVVGIGNVSLRSGGRSKWHRSHQTGRDVDIAMFHLDRRGKRVNPGRFRSYGPDLKSLDGQGMVFDVERNLDLVLAMVEDMDVGVQWIFCAEALKQAMISLAKERGLDDEIVKRISSVVHQPTDALPHDDHFHVRIYCSVDDRLYGCLDRAPFWPWIDRGEEAFVARVKALARILAHEAIDLRLAAVKWLERIRARPAVPQLVELLEDPETRLANAALSALKAVGDPAAIPGILGALSRSVDAKRAKRLYRAIPSFWHRDTLHVAKRFVTLPEKMLSPEVAKGDLGPFLQTSASLYERFGTLEDAPELLALLDHERKAVRTPAESALTRITAHVARPAAATAKGRKRTRAVQWWRELVEGADDWHGLLRQGVERAGHRLPDDLTSRRGVQALIRAVDDERKYISHNAVRILSKVTGHEVEPYWRSRRALKRHWNRWWDEHGDTWKHAPPADPAEIQGAP